MSHQQKGVTPAVTAVGVAFAANDKASIAHPQQDVNGLFILAPLELLADRNLRACDLRVLLCYLAHANWKQPGRTIWPSTATVAREVGLAATRFALRQVRDSVRRLCAQGYLRMASEEGRRFRVRQGERLLEIERARRVKHTPPADRSIADATGEIERERRIEHTPPVTTDAKACESTRPAARSNVRKVNRDTNLPTIRRNHTTSSSRGRAAAAFDESTPEGSGPDVIAAISAFRFSQDEAHSIARARPGWDSATWRTFLADTIDRARKARSPVGYLIAVARDAGGEVLARAANPTTTQWERDERLRNGQRV